MFHHFRIYAVVHHPFFPGVIRDFAGPYYVSEDCMAFGKPTKYWRLNLDNVPHGSSAWDKGVIEASNIYKKRMVS